MRKILGEKSRVKIAENEENEENEENGRLNEVGGKVY